MGRKFDIDENGNVFKLQEDGTILRVGKIDEENNRLKKVKKPVQTIKGLNKAIIICLITLLVTKEIIVQQWFFIRFEVAGGYAYYPLLNLLSYIAIFISIAIIILLFAKKIKWYFGLVCLLVSIFTVLSTNDNCLYIIPQGISSLVELATQVVLLIYIYKFSLTEKTKDKTND
jgi:hypothetical protein